MAWWDRDRPDDQAKPALRDRVRSIYEQRFKREDPASSEIILNQDGNPQIVVAGGRPIGLRCRDGSVALFPEPPVDPSQWPESWWGDGRGHDG